MEQAIVRPKTYHKNGLISLGRLTDQETGSRVLDGWFAVNTKTVIRALTVMAVALIFVHMAISIGDNLTGYDSKLFSRLNKVFSLDLELNVSSYFSTLTLLFSSSLLALIAFFRRKQKAPFVHWALLSAGFLFMSFDEIASVHERLVEPLRELMGGQNLGLFYFAWVVPGIVLVLILGGAFLRFWWRLPSKTRLFTMAAAILYLAGALGMEMVDGGYAEIHGTNNLTYMLLTCIEESLEMAGIIVLVKTLLDYIASNLPGIRLDLVNGSPPSKGGAAPLR